MFIINALSWLFAIFLSDYDYLSISECIPMSSKQQHSMPRENMISEFCEEVIYTKISSDLNCIYESMRIIDNGCLTARIYIWYDIVIKCKKNLYINMIIASSNVIYLNKSKYTPGHCLFLQFTVMPLQYFYRFQISFENVGFIKQFTENLHYNC